MKDLGNAITIYFATLGPLKTGYRNGYRVVGKKKPHRQKAMRLRLISRGDWI